MKYLCLAYFTIVFFIPTFEENDGMLAFFRRTYASFELASFDGVFFINCNVFSSKLRKLFHSKSFLSKNMSFLKLA